MNEPTPQTAKQAQQAAQGAHNARFPTMASGPEEMKEHNIRAIAASLMQAYVMKRFMPGQKGEAWKGADKVRDFAKEVYEIAEAIYDEADQRMKDARERDKLVGNT